MARPRFQRKRGTSVNKPPKLGTKLVKPGSKAPHKSSEPPQSSSKPPQLGTDALARRTGGALAIEAIQISRKWGPAVIKATEKILALGRQALRQDMETRVQIGEELVRAQELLEHGRWMEWVDTELPFAQRTADLMMQQYFWARDNPRRFAMLAPLGITKLRMLQRKPEKALKSLFGKRLHTVPDTRRNAPEGATQQRTLQQMSTSQLKALLASPAPAPLPEPLSPRGTVKRYRQQTRELAGTVDALLQLGDAVSQRTLVKLYNELTDVLGTLEQALDE